MFSLCTKKTPVKLLMSIHEEKNGEDSDFPLCVPKRNRLKRLKPKKPSPTNHATTSSTVGYTPYVPKPGEKKEPEVAIKRPSKAIRTTRRNSRWAKQSLMITSTHPPPPPTNLPFDDILFLKNGLKARTKYLTECESKSPDNPSSCQPPPRPTRGGSVTRSGRVYR